MRKMILILLIPPLLFSCTKEAEISDDRLKVTALNFPCYDAARAVLAESADLVMLTPPGSDVHSWEPSPEDVIRILSSDIFIYTGGENDSWVEGLLTDVGDDTLVFSLLDHSPSLFAEEVVEGMQEEHDHGHEAIAQLDSEYDEHVWTSLENMASIIEALKDEIIAIDPGRKDFYESNASAYTASILDIKTEIESVVESARRHLLVVADRFPFLYFVREFGLSYYAAFPGCAGGTEPSARTVSFLIDKVKDEAIPVILHIELSNTMLSSLISEETGARVMELNSAQNISMRDFNRGRTYLDIMRTNLDVLREALN